MEPIRLAAGAVVARGDARPQVRDLQRAADLGDLDAQAAAVQAVIAEALAGVLAGMTPDREQLGAWRDEIASVTLVAANSRLAMFGIMLLDLTIATFAFLPIED